MIADAGRWPLPKKPGLWWNIGTYTVCVSCAAMCKIALCYLNSTKVYGGDILRNAVHERTSGKSLITVSNHYSCIDDPIYLGILPWKSLLFPFKLRWTPAAHDICFTQDWHAMFFGLGRTIPIVRGAGVYQKGMDFILEKMNNGEWAHIFPEGKINVDKTCMRLKWGVGRLVSECQHTPVVLPFYLVGLDDILPNHSPHLPRIGKKATIVVGEPLNFEARLKKCREQGQTHVYQRKMVTDSIQEELKRLKVEAYRLHNAGEDNIHNDLSQKYDN